MNADIPSDSWRVLQAMRPNVLVIDPDACHRRRVVDAVLEGSRGPVWRCEGTPLLLPKAGVGTLLLNDAGDLTAAEQGQLLAWIECNRATQVITVAPQPLYPGVAAGTFLDGLYYRLNVLVVDSHIAS
jgi:transcriptional regulator of aromatic amino acid metabolism